jgi:hypothetical protein
VAKSIAVEGDVSATPGNTPYTGAESGSWTAGTITYQGYDPLTIGGTRVVREASCTFSFSGASSSGATITGTETVTLSASATKLQGGSSNLLVDGDSEVGSYGNELLVQTGAKLQTA